MIDNEVAADLRELGVPILALGDPAQLPPVGGGRGALTDAEPDVFLTEIHRQALDNPIIRLSMLAREGRPIPDGVYGESHVLPLSMAAVARSRADQILCGTNKTRHAINAAVRRERGLGDWLPAAGERLVCLQNRHGLGLLNGTIWIVLQAVTGRGRETGREMVKLDLASEEGFVEFGLPVDRFFEYFDFGYALTVHKAQGSEWDSVMLVDESRVFGNEADRWRYTGITRASRRLTLARRLRGRR